MSPVTSFCAAEKWPPLKICCPNPQYADEMLSNIGACNSEMSAVSLYFYNSIVLTDTNREFAEIFHKISIVEMHHLEIFAQLARMLGADPRLWTVTNNRSCYWTPSCNNYPTQIKYLLENSLRGEQDAILKYRRQTCAIQDSYIVAILNRIILDEQIHVEILRKMLAEISA